MNGRWTLAPVSSTRPVGRVEADLLVACDGVHSVVRRTLYPDEGPPKWNGITMWRALMVGEPFLSGRTVMMMAGHFRRRMVIYPISKRYEDQGRALINWVAELNTADDQPMPRQDWEHTARLEDMLEPFASHTFDFLDVPALIRGAEVIYQYPMVDRDPLPTWNFGQVTLLGDAAHPMYPVGSNGASQAILDARILAPGAGAPAVDRGGRGRVRRPAPPSYRHGGAGQPPGGSGAVHGDRRATGSRRLHEPRRHSQPAGTGGNLPRLQAHRGLRPRDPQQPALAVGPLSLWKPVAHVKEE